MNAERKTHNSLWSGICKAYKLWSSHAKVYIRKSIYSSHPLAKPVPLPGLGRGGSSVLFVSVSYLFLAVSYRQCTCTIERDQLFSFFSLVGNRNVEVLTVWLLFLPRHPNISEVCFSIGKYTFKYKNINMYIKQM